MKIIILAAGIESRLGNPFPKPLTPLKNEKVLCKCRPIILLQDIILMI
jgi:choline kinase